MDGPTDGPMDGPTDGPIDGPTDPLAEMRSWQTHLKTQSIRFLVENFCFFSNSIQLNPEREEVMSRKKSTLSRSQSIRIQILFPNVFISKKSVECGGHLTT